ncbi:hypothetical protein P261_02544 [Lachnospiraceae bacterium TWA4]|nr:hypothetical protein P261_02544 [Lachnospiraceae bacterium TWA4]
MIRDEKNEAIGMFCINYDITAIQQVRNLMNGFLNQSPQEFSTEPAQDVLSVIDQLIFNIIGAQDVKNLSRKKCVEMVKFMDEKGIFLVKGAIDKVAQMMGVSKVTVYSYLDEAKGKR